MVDFYDLHFFIHVEIYSQFKKNIYAEYTKHKTASSFKQTKILLNFLPCGNVKRNNF